MSAVVCFMLRVVLKMDSARPFAAQRQKPAEVCRHNHGNFSDSETQVAWSFKARLIAIACGGRRRSRYVAAQPGCSKPKSRKRDPPYRAAKRGKSPSVIARKDTESGNDSVFRCCRAFRPCI